MNDAKITAAIHAWGHTWWVVSGQVHQYSDVDADDIAVHLGQRIVRHDDGSCTIEDLPKPKTALELIEELRNVGRGQYPWAPPKLSPRLDDIAEAIREGRAM